MDDDERSAPLPNPNGDDQKPEIDETDMLKMLRKLSQEAHIERRRYFAITMAVVVGVFAFRQFVPPVWTIWL